MFYENYAEKARFWIKIIIEICKKSMSIKSTEEDGVFSQDYVENMGCW